MARVSVLQLDTRFCRVPGDVGCADTYVNTPEIIRVPRASVANVVSDQPDQIDFEPFLKAIEQASGDIIVTSCGFLSPFQGELQNVTDKPVIASVLNVLSDLKVPKGSKRSSVLTFDAERLVDAHFCCAAFGVYRGANLYIPISLFPFWASWLQRNHE